MVLALCGSFFLAAISLFAMAGYWLVVRHAGGSGGVPPAPAAERAAVAGPTWLETLVRLGEWSPHRRDEARPMVRRLAAAGLRSGLALPVFRGAEVACAIAALLATAVALVLLTSADWFLGGLTVVLSGYAGLILPDKWLERRIKRRREDLLRAVPDFLDLLVISLESGISLDQAISQAGGDLRKAHPTLADETDVFHMEMRAGTDRSTALRNLGQRSGEPEMRRVAGFLLQADRFGTSIAKTLRGQARRVRQKRRQRAEEQAHKIPVKIIFPVFFLIMPTIFLVTAGPAILTLLSSFSTAFGR